MSGLLGFFRQFVALFEVEMGALTFLLRDINTPHPFPLDVRWEVGHDVQALETRATVRNLIHFLTMTVGLTYPTSFTSFKHKTCQDIQLFFVVSRAECFLMR